MPCFPTRRVSAVLAALVVSACGLALPGCGGGTHSPEPPPGSADPPRDTDPGPAWFADATPGSGIDFTYRNGEEADHYALLESLGGGVGLVDYDGDGLLDVFLTGGGYYDGPDRKQIKGHPNRLFKNLGNWRFRDVTTEVGLGGPAFYGHGCAVGDYDNDGRPDLLVTGYGRLALYHNRGGRAFEEVTREAGLPTGGDLHWSTGAAWADLDGDGAADLFVIQYLDWSFRNHPRCPGPGPHGVEVCNPNPFGAMPQLLYLNNGNGTFRDGGRAAGVKPAKALGVLVADADGDGKPDVYVASDLVANHLYLNRGGGVFEETGLTRGVAYNELGTPSGSMGVDAADYDGSGHLSYFVTNFQGMPHDLYRNRGKGWFHHASRRAGITQLGLDLVGWGTGFIDLDRDGAEDLFVSNGHAYRYPFPPATVAQRAVLLRNQRVPGQPPAEVRFEDISTRGGPYFRVPHRGRGVAFGDLDNDGLVDVVVSHCNEPVTLLRNTHPAAGHWLGVRLEGRPYRDAVGAVLTLEVGGQRLVRHIKGGGSYLSASDPRVVFGLGESSRADRLTLRWPSGKSQTWDGARLEGDRYLLLREGEEAVGDARAKSP